MHWPDPVALVRTCRGSEIRESKRMKLISFISALIAVIPCQLQASGQAPLSLQEAVERAIDEDPWLAGSRFEEAALKDEAVAAASLPDPKITVSALNLPTDSFEFGQEAMTQAAVGMAQTFPRGESRSLAKKRKLQVAMREPLLRVDRKARVRATVTRLWLEVFRAQESIRIIEANRNLFEQLVEVAEAGYASTQGRVRQQDIVRAQLELTRLEDSLTALQQQQETARRRLAEWIGEPAGRPLKNALPELSPALPDLGISGSLGTRELYSQLSHHPAVQALQQRIDSLATGVELAEQAYKPEWTVNAQYGYRDADPLGNERSDLFSVGFSFDLPIFTDNRQGRQVSAAVARTEGAKTDKLLLLRRLASELEAARAQLAYLNDRKTLYAERLLPQMSDQSRASLAAYNNDVGDFSEAVRARIAELSARVDALDIDVSRLKTMAQIDYLLVQTPVAELQLPGSE